MSQQKHWAAWVLFALVAGCGTKGSGTFVALDFSATGTAPRVVHTIDVDLELDGRSGHAHFAGKSGGDITLPTDGTVELGSLGGALSLTATAKDASGTALATAHAQATIAANGSSHLSVVFGGSSPDAGSTGGGSGSDARDDAADGGTGGIQGTGGAGAAAGHGGSVGAGGGAQGGATATGGSGAKGGAAATGGTGASGGAGGSGGQGTLSLAVDKTTLDFGSVLLSMTSPLATLTYTNTGTLALGPLMLMSSDGTHFSVTNETCTNKTLAPGGTCVVTLTFAPSSTGLLTGTLSVGTGSALHADTMLSGSGYAPNSPAQIVITPSHDFRVVDVGTRVSFDLVVSNSGGSASSSVSISAGAAPFSLGADGCTGKTLPAGGQCTVTVNYVPTAAGVASASITAVANTGGAAACALSGTGRATVALAITLVGGGTVSAPGLSCAGSTCTGSYGYTDPSRPPMIQMNGMPDAYSVFGGWSGTTACANAPSCAFTLATDTKLTATFNPRIVNVNLSVVSLGGQTGVLTSADGKLACKDNCPALQHAATPQFSLEAAANTGSSTFAAWNSAYLTVNGSPCHGTSPKCVFDLTGDVNVTAVFGPQAYMFVTSTTIVPGLLGGVAGADYECAQRARSAGLPGTYSAWMSGGAFNANQRVGKGGWIRTDGRVFASSLAALTASGNFQSFYPPRVDENGNDLGPQSLPIATGANQDGSSFGAACGDYTTTKGDLYVGSATSGAGYWSYDQLASGGCAQSYRLYCFRNDLAAELKTPSIPGRRIFVSRTQLPIGSGAATADNICHNEAKAAGYPAPSNVIALISTSTTTAASRLNFNGPPWKRPDEVQVVLAPQDLGRGLLLAPIDVLADGVQHVSHGIWSGSSDIGTLSTGTQSCRDWSDSSRSSTGFYGYPNQGTTLGWWSGGLATCDSPGLYVLCLEQ